MKYIKEMMMHYLQGNTLKNWIRLLLEIKFKIEIKNIPKVLYITFMIVLVTPIRLYEALKYRKKIMNTEITKEPVFILGHWRSGTTYLNNLISQDDSFGYFNMIQSVVPAMYLSSEKWLKIIFNFVMPKKRPMDSIKLDIDSPQEEEYAIANTLPYSFSHIASFPQQRERLLKYLTFDDVPDRVREEWKKTFDFVLRKQTYKLKGQRLLIKNPLNTCRIKMILEKFPNAKFIHIYRDPYKVYKSARKMYESLFTIFRLEKPVGEEEGIEYQMEVYERFFKKYFEEKDSIPENNLIEIRYEDFVKEPVAFLKDIYEELEIEGFEKCEPKFRNYINAQDQYRTNNHEVDHKKRKTIYERFAFVVKKLKYYS
jgi:hypothetical protein